MAAKKSELILFFRDLPHGRKNWGWFLLVGILLIILGGLAIGYAGLATEITVIFLGFVLAGGGILQITSSYYLKKWTGFSLHLLLGLLYIIAGGLCIFKPISSAVGITLFIAAILLVGGAFRLVTALSHRFEYWRWMVFSGLISILLGFFILAEWPASSFWVIGLFVGIDLILIGVSWVLLSLAARE